MSLKRVPATPLITRFLPGSRCKMRKSIIVLLASVILIMAIILLGPDLAKFGSSAKQATTAATTSESLASADPEEKEAVTGAQRQSIPTPSTVKPQTVGRSASFYAALGKLRGRVLGADGSPRANATIKFVETPWYHRQDSPDGLPWDNWELHSTRSASDGSFEFQDIWLGNVGRLTIFTEAGEQYIEPRLHLASYSILEGSICDLGDIKLDEHALISGRLVASSGELLDGVEIHAYATMNDVDTLSELFDKSHFDSTAPHTYASGTQLKMQNGLEKAFWSPLPLSPHTDADGKFSFALPHGNWLLSFLAKPPLLSWARALAVTSKGVQLGDVTIPSERLVTGEVIDRGGKSIPGAELLVATGKSWNMRGLRLPPSDTSGRFQLRCAQTEPLTIGARSAGGIWQFSEVAADQDHLVIELDPGFHLDVTVLDAKGEPSDAKLQLCLIKEDSPEGQYGVKWASDGLIDLKSRSLRRGPGQTRITGLHADSFLLSATKDGRLAASAEIELADHHHVKLTLTEGQWLTIETVDSKGQVISDVSLDFWTRVGNKRRWTDRSGKASIATTDFDRVNVNVRHPGYATSKVSTDLPCDSLRITLQPWCVIHGRVTSSALDHKGWTVSFVGKRARPLDDAELTHEEWKGEADAAADGSFSIRCPPMHDCSITTVYDGSKQLRHTVNGLVEHKFSVDNSTRIELAVHAQWQETLVIGTVHGTVSINGRSTAGLQMTCSQPGLIASHQTRTGSDGSFSFDVHKPQFTLSVRSTGLFGGMSLFQREYQLSEKPLSIELQAGTVKVKVNNQAGSSIAGAHLLLKPYRDARKSSYSMTDDKGNATWDWVKSGRYCLAATTEETVAVSLPFDLMEGETAQINLQTSPGVTFTGRIEFHGYDVDWDTRIKVSLRDNPTMYSLRQDNGAFNFKPITSGDHVVLVTFQPKASQGEMPPKQVTLEQAVHIPEDGLDGYKLVFTK